MSNNKVVTVHPLVLSVMASHALAHPDQAVLGLLVGTNSQEVQDAVPLTHRALTLPLLETAMGLLQKSLLPENQKIIGCYVVPALLKDARPSPVALRLAAQLANKNEESTLLVLENDALISFLSPDSTNPPVQAYGPDFAGQYLEKVDTRVHNVVLCRDVVRKVEKDHICVKDLDDHLEGPPDTPWYPCRDIQALL